MPDDSLNIAVNITSTGGDAAAVKVENIGKAAKKSGDEATKASQVLQDSLNPAMVNAGKGAEKAAEGVHHAELRHRELHRAAGMLGPVLGEVAVAMNDLAHNPMMATILLVTAACEALKVATEAMIPELVNVGKSIAPSMMAANERTLAAATALAKFREEMRNVISVEKQLADQASERETQIHDEASAHEALAEAVKKVSEEKLKAALAEGRINQSQYNIGMADLSDRDEREKAAIKQQEREAIQAEKLRQYNAARGASKEATEKHGLAKGESDKADNAAAENDERVKALTANLATYHEEQVKADQKTQKGRIAYWEYQNLINEAENKRAALLKRQAVLDEAKVTKDAETARLAATAKTLQERANDLQQEHNALMDHNRRLVESEGRTLDLNSQARGIGLAAEFAKTPEGQQIQQAMQSADVWRKSGSIGGADKASLMALYQRLYPGRKPSDSDLQGAFSGAGDAGRFGGLAERGMAQQDLSGAEATANVLRAGGQVGTAAEQQMLAIGQMLAGHAMNLEKTLQFFASLAANNKRQWEAINALQAQMGNVHNQ